MSSEIISALGLLGAAIVSGVVALRANRTGFKADRETLIDKRIEMLFSEQEDDRKSAREELRIVRKELADIREEYRACLDLNAELRQTIRELREVI